MGEWWWPFQIVTRPAQCHVPLSQSTPHSARHCSNAPLKREAVGLNRLTEFLVWQGLPRVWQFKQDSHRKDSESIRLQEVFGPLQSYMAETYIQDLQPWLIYIRANNSAVVTGQSFPKPRASSMPMQWSGVVSAEGRKEFIRQALAICATLLVLQSHLVKSVL